MNQPPFVSVVIPCHNAERYIAQAVESMVTQTRTPDEIIIVDDCSTDGSWHIVEALSREHDIVHAFRNDTNQGIPITRNRLIAEMSSNSDYMAILDADDVAVPQRIERQLGYMETHPDCLVLGSDIGIIDETGTQTGVRIYPHSHRDIKKTALHFSPFAQPAVMLRTSVFDTVGVYDERLARCQDYDLWLRILASGGQTANLPEPLTQFRRHKDQGKETMAKKSLYYSVRVRLRYILNLRMTSPKAFVILGAYLVALAMPQRLLNWVFAKLFVRSN